MSEVAALEARGLTVAYGGVVAVQGLSFAVAPGSLTGLIGPNGAGKTTALDALTGFVAHRGRVLVDGIDLSGRSPDARARAGLARTWQTVELFDDLTVRENCAVAAHPATIGSSLRELVWPSRAPELPLVDATLELLGLDSVADRLPRALPLGHQKLVGVARALASDPTVLLLDEPAAGLSIPESRELGGRLSEVARSGTTVVLVDHDMGLVLSVCDDIVVLDFGEVIARGAPRAVRDDQRVIEAYLGDGRSGELSRSDLNG